jgi:M6 family metalloprotease-like protein
MRTHFQSIIPTLLLFLLPWQALAITKPKTGPFPKGFWEKVMKNPDLVNYGDPGWMKRMERRRLLMERIARGKATVLQAAYSDRFVMPLLLGQYSDKSGTMTIEDFQNLFFSDSSETGTLRQYYLDASYGQFELTGETYGWFTVDQTQSYYAGSDNGMSNNFPQNVNGFVREVVEKADPTVDFGRFDNDGPDGVPNSGDDDGYVDGVYVICPGFGPDHGSGDKNNLWPCSGVLGANEYTTADLSANGGYIKINTWGISAELYRTAEDSPEVIRPFGVVAHEFGHILGLPDLYDRTDSTQGPDFQGSEGLGSWCLMGSGNWGGDQEHPETPAMFSVWCKKQMGWIAPLVIGSDSSISLEPIETAPQSYKIWEDNSQLSRYFLLENRQKTGFDRYLPGSGLMIYHVDENRWFGPYDNGSSPINNYPGHKMVDLEEADGRDDLDYSVNRGDDGDPYPGASGNRNFDDTSYPSSKDYDGQSTGIAVRNISESARIITAEVSPRRTEGYAIAYDKNGLAGWSFGGEQPEDFWGGVLFTAREAGILTALDVGFIKDSVAYEIYIYNSFSGSSPQDLLSTQLGISGPLGWQTIPLLTEVPVNKDQDFFVTVKVVENSYALSYDPYGEKTGRSYSSKDGINFVSIDSDGSTGSNFNIRARIRTAASASLALYIGSANCLIGSSARVGVNYLTDNTISTISLTLTFNQNALQVESVLLVGAAQAMTLSNLDIAGANSSGSLTLTVNSGTGATIPAGEGRIIEIRFKDQARSAQAVDLTASDFSARTPTGSSFALSVTNGRFTVMPKTCDLNADRSADILDVVTLLLGMRNDPENLLWDWNDDSRIDIADAMAMLRDIRDSNCPSSQALLAGTGNSAAYSWNGKLTQADIAYLKGLIGQLHLNPEEKELVYLALYGRKTAPELPRVFDLAQNSPNPFNPSTTIRYSVPEGNTCVVRLTIYDLKGRLVRALAEGSREPGLYSVFWDGMDGQGQKVSSGVYFYRLEAGSYNKTRKMVLIK